MSLEIVGWPLLTTKAVVHHYNYDVESKSSIYTAGFRLLYLRIRTVLHAAAT